MIIRRMMPMCYNALYYIALEEEVMLNELLDNGSCVITDII